MKTEQTETIADLLVQTRGNQSEVARILDVQRSTIAKYREDIKGRYHKVIDDVLYTARS